MYITTRKGGTVFTYSDGEIYMAMDRAGRQTDLKGRKLAFDEVTDFVDSAFACRVIKALQEKLDPSELGRVLQILQDADVITKNERDAVNEEMKTEENGPREEMASDASFDERFPDAKRLKTGTAFTGAPMRTTHQPMTAAQERDFAERFPDAGRLKA